MQTKLTLRLEEQLIEQAKAYAGRTGKSLSQVVADYFRLLTTEKKAPQTTATPVTQSLRGLLREAKIDEADYKRHLERKHR